MATIRVEIRDAEGNLVADASREIASGDWATQARSAGHWATDLAMRRAEFTWVNPRDATEPRPGMTEEEFTEPSRPMHDVDGNVVGSYDRELADRARRGEIGRRMPFTPER